MAREHTDQGLESLGSTGGEGPARDAALQRLVIAGNLMAAQIDVLLDNRHLDKKTSAMLMQSSIAWDHCLRKLHRKQATKQ